MPDVELRPVGRNEGFPANNQALARSRRRPLRRPGEQRRLRRAGLVWRRSWRRSTTTPRSVRSAPSWCSPRGSPRWWSRPGVRPRSGRRPVAGRDAPRRRGRRRRRLAATPTRGRAAGVASRTATATFEWLAPQAVVRVPIGEPGTASAARRPCSCRHRRRSTSWSTAAPARSSSPWGRPPTQVTVAHRGSDASTCSTTSARWCSTDGAGADRGWLERGRRPVRRARPRSSPGAAGRCCCDRRTSPTSACSTSGSSSTTRTPTCRGGAGPAAGGTAPCPQSRVRHLHAASSGRGLRGLRLPRRAQSPPHAGEERPGRHGAPTGRCGTCWSPPPTPGATSSVPALVGPPAAPHRGASSGHLVRGVPPAARPDARRPSALCGAVSSSPTTTSPAWWVVR